MARAKKDIKKSMTDAYIANDLVKQAYGLDAGKTFDDEFSTASLENIIFETLAFSIWFLENVFDIFVRDTKAYIAAMKPGSTRWYAQKALMYQHGFPLIADSDVFDNAGHNDEQIADSKIVKYAACVEEASQNGQYYLRIKVAGADGNDLQPLAQAEVDGVAEYFKRIKYAGIPVRVDSNAPDKIKMQWKVYYDPLILNATGSRLDGTGDEVVKAAIKEYLTRLPFNGVYAIQKHEDHVQQVPGVALCPVQTVQRQFANYAWEYIQQIVTPDAGYLRFAADTDLEIVYVPKGGVV